MFLHVDVIADHLDEIEFNQGLLENVVNAHHKLMYELRTNITRSQLNGIKVQCLSRLKPDGVKLQKQIKKAKTVEKFFNTLVKASQYCNWLNMDLVETIVIESGSNYLKKLVEKYKDQVYSKTIKQVCEGIPSLSKEVKDQCFMKVTDHFHRSPENVIVKELLPCKELSFEIAMLINIIIV